MSLFDDASLVLIPDGAKDGTLYSVKPTDGTGDFTFTRGSNLAATRVDENGLIEKGRENLLTYSNDFSNAIWTKTTSTVISGQSGYDGSSNAWKLQSTGAGNPQLVQTTLNTSVKSHSIYAKAGSISILRIWVGQAKEFDLSAGTTSSSNCRITAVGATGWYRCEVFDVFASFNPYFPATGAGEYIYIQDAQLEVGLVATDYIETGATTAQAGILEDLPRIDYSGGASCPALLLEPQRTNLIVHSEYTDGTNWSNEGSITDEENTSETTSPEGVYNAVKLVSANATSEQWIQATGISVTSGNDYTISCFVKKSDYDYFHLRYTGIGGAFSAGSVWFDIAEGSVGTIQSGSGIVADIEDYGNGWYRIWATKQSASTASAGVRFELASSDGQSSVVGDGSKGTYAYGFQVEEGSYPTSYIPTYGSSVTRSADSCSKTSATALIGQTEGTFFLDFENIEKNGITYLASIDNGTSSERIEVFAYFGNISVSVRVGGVQQVNMISSVDAAGSHKIAFSYKANDFALYIDGVQISLDTSGTIPTTNEIKLYGRYDENNGGGAQELKQALVFKTRLSNTQLAALTTL